MNMYPARLHTPGGLQEGPRKASGHLKHEREAPGKPHEGPRQASGHHVQGLREGPRKASGHLGHESASRKASKKAPGKPQDISDIKGSPGRLREGP